jgi:gamma-glutamyltranspeptidase / glutathione hydrolase
MKAHMRNSFVALAAVLAMTVQPAWTSAALAQDDLGPASLPTVKTGVAAHAMVAAANPLAVAAGVKVLKAGGSAMDAAVAVQAVLGLVEPQSSGLGGGAFLVYYDARSGKVTAYNGREIAPAGARPDMFLGADGKPLPFFQGVLSGRSTGVPGAIAMLAQAHKDHGKLAWKDLFSDAIRLSDQGFKVSPRLAADINSTRVPQAGTPDAKAHFTKPDGTLYQVGDLLKSPAYAATLRRLATEGVGALYRGPIAADIAAKTHEEPRPGTLTAEDMAVYRPQVSDALCRPYRQYRICAPPPPAGGVGVLELMGELERTDIASRGPKDPQAWYEFAEASRLAYADRDHYIGDPDFVKAPVAGLIDPAYDASRGALIEGLGGAPAKFGTPAGAEARGPDRTAEPGGTTDLAIVDAQGNVVSMTTTVESVFGSGRMVDGFFLNNQLTDFSFSPTDADGAPAANAVGPHKRPRSSMSPVIVLDAQGRFVAALGSPGGGNIIGYVAKALVGLLDWKLPIGEAFALPNVIGHGDSVAVEAGADPAIVAYLQSKGVKVRANAGEESGLHGVVATAKGYEGAADPRREGIATGY